MGRLLQASDDKLEVVELLFAEHALQVARQSLRLVRRKLLPEQRRDPDEFDTLVAGERVEKVVQVSGIGSPLHLEHHLERLKRTSGTFEDSGPSLQL